MSFAETSGNRPVTLAALLWPLASRPMACLFSGRQHGRKGSTFQKLHAESVRLPPYHLAPALEQSDALSVSRIFGLDTKDVELICLCFVGGATSAQIHYSVRRLRRKMPEAFILLS